MNQKLSQLKALSDANRLGVIMALLEEEELCACQITAWLGVTGPTVSRHLKQLEQCGLLEARKEGRWVHYRLGTGFPPELAHWLTPGLAPADRSRLSLVLRQNPSDLCRQQRAPRLP